MVGEGVLLECLSHPQVGRILVVGRRPYEVKYPKLKELIVADFFNLEQAQSELSGYDACFFCAGVSSIGMNEKEYTKITFDLTLHFARTVSRLNPGMVFCYISGKLTDSSEKGRVMWARVKGRTENELMKLPFKNVYNFRPGMLKATKGQKSLKRFYKIIMPLYPLVSFLYPSGSSTLKELSLAMINSVLKGSENPVLEVKDIKQLAKQ